MWPPTTNQIIYWKLFETRSEGQLGVGLAAHLESGGGWGAKRLLHGDSNLKNKWDLTIEHTRWCPQDS